MKLEHSFTVPVGIDEAWRILLDIERIGPCMPGAAIDSVDGDDFTGTVKVKLGPIGLTYKGKASFIEKDGAAHRAVIDARGRDARGNGTASAKVTAVLTEESGGSTTRVSVNTDLDITGKPAQFGRGVMVDVGNKLIGQFADSLAQTITDGDGGAAGGGTAGSGGVAAVTAVPEPVSSAPQRAARPTPTGAAAVETDAGPGEQAPVNGAAAAPAPRRPVREVEPINLIESAGPAVAKRLAPVAIAVVLIIGVVGYRKRRS